jgi:hypothetical protein
LRADTCKGVAIFLKKNDLKIKRRNMKLPTCALFVVTLLGVMFALPSAVADSETQQTATLSVSPSSITMKVGEIAKLAVSNAFGKVSVESGDKSVLSASYSGITLTLTGLKVGATQVKVSDNKTSRKIPVTVQAAATSGLTVSPAFVSTNVGGSSAIAVSNASGTVTAVSSDTTVATVSYAGGTATLKGVKLGSAAITIKDSKTTKIVQVSVVSGAVTLSGYALLAWNDLGMHCVDGRDYSVFSILPPYNNLHAQLVNKSTGKQVTSGVTLTYESLADTTLPTSDPLYGSINTTSVPKTNFWDYVTALFGASPAREYGLNLSGAPGNRTPSLQPQPMSFAPANGWFVAEGIPIIPVDDKGIKNFYPMVKVVARDATGKVLATARTVLPVSDEMTCKACHASNTTTNPAANAARPAAGWVNDIDPDKDWKKNILRLHDERMFGNASKKPVYVAALSSMAYDPAGLYATATKTGGEPVLCASCHSSNALATSGLPNIRALTHALHSKHADVRDPTTQLSLSNIDNRTSCYMCHPGSVTQCLRGAMGNATDAAGNPSMSCQSCHGNMQNVGNTARTGWLSQPNCQACHHDGKRDTVAVNASGVLNTWTDTRFATNPDTPLAGYSLYRFSKGHGNLQCEACHGATHAEYPSSHSQDNALSIDLQGHPGTVAECAACHATVPSTVSGGPHGMHTTGDAWVSQHQNASKAGCTSCHGADYRGTPLSAIKVAKTINRKNFAAGHQMNCYDCHNGPNP